MCTPAVRLVFSLAHYNEAEKNGMYSPYLSHSGPKDRGYYFGVKAEGEFGKRVVRSSEFRVPGSEFRVCCGSFLILICLVYYLGRDAPPCVFSNLKYLFDVSGRDARPYLFSIFRV